jgi:hypothetical protein
MQIPLHGFTRWPVWLRHCLPRMFPEGKGGQCLGLTTLPPTCAYCLEILATSTSWSPKGLCRVCGDRYNFTFTFYKMNDLFAI